MYLFIHPAAHRGSSTIPPLLVGIGGKGGRKGVSNHNHE